MIDRSLSKLDELLLREEVVRGPQASRTSGFHGPVDLKQGKVTGERSVVRVPALVCIIEVGTEVSPAASAEQEARVDEKVALAVVC